ncbi:MAG: monovalent cation/H(+) antiporter subunit G [Desulfobacterales bacterium]|jgi:multicomponent Na+:H+ antiporter subunit G|nr:monovalent cation/H(+) antiporter subunit G [Desulfobacterales bacterium]
MNDAIAAVMILTGALFSLVAAVGVLRLPDILLRMHAGTKAGTMGAGLILLGVAFYDMETGVTLRALAAICFLLLTAPVSAHLIGRAAYRSGIRIWDRTRIDELGEYCRLTRHCNLHEFEPDPDAEG